VLIAQVSTAKELIGIAEKRQQ